MAENPFSRPSTLPYQLPPFDRVSNADYRPGLRRGHARAARGGAADRAQSGRAGLREHHRRPGALRAAAEPRSERLLQSERLQYRSADGQDRYRDAPRSCRRTRMRSFWTPRCLRAWLRCTGAVPSLQLDGESLQLLERYHVKFVRGGRTPGGQGQGALARPQRRDVLVDDPVQAERVESHAKTARWSSTARRAGWLVRGADRRGRERGRGARI